jgi:subtilisin family serine protease
LYFLSLMGMLLLLPAVSFAPPPTQVNCSGDYAPGMVLVGWRESTPTPEWGSDRDMLTGLNVTALKVPIGQECVALERLGHNPQVAFAELDYAIHASEGHVPNDPDWKQQWGLERIGVPQAWRMGTGTSDVLVALLDSGVKRNHPDLVNRLWINPGDIPGNDRDDDANGKVDDVWGWHFYHEWSWDGGHYTYMPAEDGRVADDNGHGTHVAGIVGAEIDNNIGVTGIAGGTRIMIVKVLDEHGVGWQSDIARGIVYAVDNGAEIINLSMGGETASQTLQEAVGYAATRGVLVVAASGNDGGEVLYPASDSRVLAVAATGPNDLRAGFSNHGSAIDLAAPGVDVYSTWPWGSGYYTKSGTSMAAPHVSGLAALIWSARPGLTVAQVTKIMTATAVDANEDVLPGRDAYLGWGRIDAGAALALATSAGSLQFSISPGQLPAGETALVTATLPAMAGTASVVQFVANDGVVVPSVAPLVDGVATATLAGGPSASMTIVTGQAERVTGTLFVRLLPGPVVSATLLPERTVVPVGDSTLVMLEATDGFGNLPLDGTAIQWSARGGTMALERTMLYEGSGQVEFRAGKMTGPALITASLASEAFTATLYVSPPYQYYMPLMVYRPKH